MAKTANIRVNRAPAEASGAIGDNRRTDITRKPTPPPSNDRGKNLDHRARFFTTSDPEMFTPYDSTWGW
jgi:hypothetical protein